MKIYREIERLDDLEDSDFSLPSWDKCYESLPLPCYLSHITETEDLDKEVPVADYLELVARELEGDISFMFSVTTQEDNFQEWLDAAQGIPGHMIYETVRGEYTCYLCIVPVTPRFEE